MNNKTNQIRSKIYSISAFLSGGCLVLMTVLVLVQIGARFVGAVVPSSEDFAGWLLSATIFFGLAYTFSEGGHIRVTMMLSKLSPPYRRILEYFNVIVGLLIGAYMAFYALLTVYESYLYSEVSDTYLAVPLWIVQTPMGIGCLFLFFALIDNFMQLLSGRNPCYVTNENEIKIE